MNMNEIATAVRHNIPVIEVVINNHVLGMVRQWQDLFYDERYSATVLRDAVDFVKLAESMGAVGVRAESQDQFQRSICKGSDPEQTGSYWTARSTVMIRYGLWLPRGAAISDAFDEEDMGK